MENTLSKKECSSQTKTKSQAVGRQCLLDSFINISRVSDTDPVSLDDLCFF